MGCVVYLMSGAPHLPYLVVSLYTLRRHYSGDIVVFAWPESFWMVQQICADPRINASARRWEPAYRGKNSQFMCKQLVMQSLGRGPNVYLDADTMVCGEVSPLFETADKYGFVATQFNQWVSNSGAPKRRIEWLRDIHGIDQAMVEQTIILPYASLNGGVFACHPWSWVLAKWHEWTMLALDLFIADEVVLHVLQPLFCPRQQMGVILGGAYNSSPKFKPDSLPDKDVQIWHFHGDSNVRPDKSQRGFDLWWPVYQECLAQDIGDIQSWRQSCGNRWIKKIEKEDYCATTD